MKKESYFQLAQMLRGKLLFNEPMALHTSLKVGGPADCFAVPVDFADLQRLTDFLIADFWSTLADMILSVHTKSGIECWKSSTFLLTSRRTSSRDCIAGAALTGASMSKTPSHRSVAVITTCDVTDFLFSSSCFRPVETRNRLCRCEPRIDAF